ncbi:YitT family protein [Nocardioides zeae]|uniref:YitT family protein n=1 Tax=Nocardioides imazamoxiresistens TaxID=3231893 RepID=A0ABU3Q187_9ACTN|nr:YitT family protein [Nocardioides zeae]MDT9595282.1 YitT family protein [Nocardioides zeae]
MNVVEPVPHSPLENVLGVMTGTFVASLGLLFLTGVDAVTGGTAGLALLVVYASGLSFGVLFITVNLPFFVLAVVMKGWAFTLRSLLCVALVSGFSELHHRMVSLGDLSEPYAVVAGNVLVGIGLLIVFRHGASLGGFNVVALLAQERLGWRAGYVQMGLDVVVVLSAAAVTSLSMVLLSAVGAALLNLVLALNHRPGRYVGA